MLEPWDPRNVVLVGDGDLAAWWVKADGGLGQLKVHKLTL